MIPHQPLSGVDPAAVTPAGSIVVEIDRSGKLVACSDAWDVLADRHDAPALRREHWLGTRLEAWLDPATWETLRATLDRLTAARPETAPEGLADAGWLRRWMPWPIFDADGSFDRLRLHPAVDADELLGRPIFRVDVDGAFDGVNRAGRALLTTAGDEGLSVTDWLALMQPPRRLVRLGGLRLDGDALLWAAPPAAWDDTWAAVLTRALRAGLHDLSNPLAGARMLAEVSRLGDDGGKSGSVVEHLDATNASLRRIRGILAADLRRQICLRAAFAQVVEMVSSELARREVEVEVEALPEDEGHHCEAMVLPFALSMVMAAVSRAAAGDRIVLTLLPCRSGSWLLEAHAVGSRTPPAFPDPAIDPALLARLAEDLGGRLTVVPGSRPQRDPEWAVAWPP
ncbi:MAG: hypothetical protein AAGE94_11575 [Acidobacteriota bacterium]